VASITTVPCTPAAFAIGGYVSRIGASSIPAETPSDIFTFFGGAATAATTWTTEPLLAELTPSGTPAGIPGPVIAICRAGSGRISIIVGIRRGGVVEIPSRGTEGLAETELAVCRTTTGFGLRIEGSVTRGASVRKDSRSGCNIGRVTKAPNAATCKKIEVNAVHRFPDDTVD
jgi:hypothetical protein